MDLDAADSRTIVDRFGEQVLDQFLSKIDVGTMFDSAFDFDLIGFLVGLGSRAVHGRAFANIEHPELNSGCIDHFAHQPAECIDLANDLPFGHSTNRRIAAHLAHGIQVGGQKGNFGADPSGSEGGFGTCMASPDHNDVVEVAICVCHVDQVPSAPKVPQKCC